jgi:hypothetical protein
MMTALPPAPCAYTADSPTARLRRRVAAALAGGRFRAACPHPAAADRLLLPSGTLTCAECRAADAEPSDGKPGECASCGAPGGCVWSTWLDEAARVLVTARICPRCAHAGNLSLAMN